MAEVALRRALRADLGTIADIWVDAFTADPWLRYMQPDDAGWAAFGHKWMRFVVDHTFERGHTFLARNQDAAIVWIPPDLSFIDAADVERAHEIIAAASGAARADDCLATMAQVRQHFSDGAHWTLQWIGVRSSGRGRGLGAALVTPGLAACDDDGLPCSLVSSNPRNVTFYERHGFRVVAEVQSPDSAVTLTPMHREPRPAHG